MSDTEGQMDSLVNDATAKLESLEKALYGLGQIRGRFTTEDGLVTAEVDGNGTLTGLWLQEAITQRAAREVGPLITWATQQAAEVAADARAKVLEQLNTDFGGPVTRQPQDAATEQ